MKPTIEQVKAALTYGSEPVYFVAEPMRIGKHEWTVIVHTGRFGRCTLYLWRPFPEPWDFPGAAERWRPHTEWPSYNGDHCDGGMPKSLRKLYEANKVALDEHLHPADCSKETAT